MAVWSWRAPGLILLASVWVFPAATWGAGWSIESEGSTNVLGLSHPALGTLRLQFPEVLLSDGERFDNLNGLPTIWEAFTTRQLPAAASERETERPRETPPAEPFASLDKPARLEPSEAPSPTSDAATIPSESGASAPLEPVSGKVTLRHPAPQELDLPASASESAPDLTQPLLRLEGIEGSYQINIYHRELGRFRLALPEVMGTEFVILGSERDCDKLRWTEEDGWFSRSENMNGIQFEARCRVAPREPAVELEITAHYDRPANWWTTCCLILEHSDALCDRERRRTFYRHADGWRVIAELDPSLSTGPEMYPLATAGWLASVWRRKPPAPQFGVMAVQSAGSGPTLGLMFAEALSLTSNPINPCVHVDAGTVNRRVQDWRARGRIVFAANGLDELWRDYQRFVSASEPPTTSRTQTWASVLGMLVGGLLLMVGLRRWFRHGRH